MPEREEGLIYFPMRVRPAVQKDPSYLPGFKKNHYPIKAHTTLRKFTRCCGRSRSADSCHVLLLSCFKLLSGPV